MHPIERLRYVARSSGGDQAALVSQSAGALASLGLGGPDLVAAARRLLDRNPTAGPLWWLCGRILTAPDAWQAAREAVAAVEDDPTVDHLVDVVPDSATVSVVGWPELVAQALARRGDLEVLAVDALGEAAGLVRRLAHAGVDALDVPAAGLAAAVEASDLVLLETVAAGTRAAVVVSGSVAAAAVAAHHEVPVWLVAGAGRSLPGPVFDEIVSRLRSRPTDPWDLDEEVVAMSLVTSVVCPEGPAAPGEPRAGQDEPVAGELLRGGSAPGTFDRPRRVR